jgi:hypothetical protein
MKIVSENLCQICHEHFAAEMENLTFQSNTLNGWRLFHIFSRPEQNSETWLFCDTTLPAGGRRHAA